MITDKNKIDDAQATASWNMWGYFTAEVPKASKSHKKKHELKVWQHGDTTQEKEQLDPATKASEPGKKKYQPDARAHCQNAIEEREQCETKASEKSQTFSLHTSTENSVELTNDTSRPARKEEGERTRTKKDKMSLARVKFAIPDSLNKKKVSKASVTKTAAQNDEPTTMSTTNDVGLNLEDPLQMAQEILRLCAMAVFADERDMQHAVSALHRAVRLILMSVRRPLKIEESAIMYPELEKLSDSDIAILVSNDESVESVTPLLWKDSSQHEDLALALTDTINNTTTRTAKVTRILRDTIKVVREAGALSDVVERPATTGPKRESCAECRDDDDDDDDSSIETATNVRDTTKEIEYLQPETVVSIVSTLQEAIASATSSVLKDSQTEEDSYAAPLRSDHQGELNIASDGSRGSVSGATGSSKITLSDQGESHIASGGFRGNYSGAAGVGDDLVPTETAHTTGDSIPPDEDPDTAPTRSVQGQPHIASDGTRGRVSGASDPSGMALPDQGESRIAAGGFCGSYSGATGVDDGLFATVTGAAQTTGDSIEADCVNPGDQFNSLAQAMNGTWHHFTEPTQPGKTQDANCVSTARPHLLSLPNIGSLFVQPRPHSKVAKEEQTANNIVAGEKPKRCANFAADLFGMPKNSHLADTAATATTKDTKDDVGYARAENPEESDKIGSSSTMPADLRIDVPVTSIREERATDGQAASVSKTFSGGLSQAGSDSSTRDTSDSKSKSRWNLPRKSSKVKVRKSSAAEESASCAPKNILQITSEIICHDSVEVLRAASGSPKGRAYTEANPSAANDAVIQSPSANNDATSESCKEESAPKNTLRITSEIVGHDSVEVLRAAWGSPTGRAYTESSPSTKNDAIIQSPSAKNDVTSDFCGLEVLCGLNVDHVTDEEFEVSLRFAKDEPEAQSFLPSEANKQHHEEKQEDVRLYQASSDQLKVKVSSEDAENGEEAIEVLQAAPSLEHDSTQKVPPPSDSPTSPPKDEAQIQSHYSPDTINKDAKTPEKTIRNTSCNTTKRTSWITKKETEKKKRVPWWRRFKASHPKVAHIKSQETKETSERLGSKASQVEASKSSPSGCSQKTQQQPKRPPSDEALIAEQIFAETADHSDPNVKKQEVPGQSDAAETQTTAFSLKETRRGPEIQSPERIASKNMMTEAPQKNDSLAHAASRRDDQETIPLHDVHSQPEERNLLESKPAEHQIEPKKPTTSTKTEDLQSITCFQVPSEDEGHTAKANTGPLGKEAAQSDSEPDGTTIIACMERMVFVTKIKIFPEQAEQNDATNQMPHFSPTAGEEARHQTNNTAKNIILPTDETNQLPHVCPTARVEAKPQTKNVVENIIPQEGGDTQFLQPPSSISTSAKDARDPAFVDLIDKFQSGDETKKGYRQRKKRSHRQNHSYSSAHEPRDSEVSEQRSNTDVFDVVPQRESADQADHDKSKNANVDQDQTTIADPFESQKGTTPDDQKEEATRVHPQVQTTEQDAPGLDREIENKATERDAPGLDREIENKANEANKEQLPVSKKDFQDKAKPQCTLFVSKEGGGPCSQDRLKTADPLESQKGETGLTVLEVHKDEATRTQLQLQTTEPGTSDEDRESQNKVNEASNEQLQEKAVNERDSQDKTKSRYMILSSKEAAGHWSPFHLLSPIMQQEKEKPPREISFSKVYGKKSSLDEDPCQSIPNVGSFVTLDDVSALAEPVIPAHACSVRGRKPPKEPEGVKKVQPETETLTPQHEQKRCSLVSRLDP